MIRMSARDPTSAHNPHPGGLGSSPVLWHAEVATAIGSDPGRFQDDNGHPGEIYLEWLADRGIVQGCDPPAYSRVCPDRTLNRAEAIKIVIGVGRLIGALPPIPVQLTDHFFDDEEIWDGAASRLANYLAWVGAPTGSIRKSGCGRPRCSRSWSWQGRCSRRRPRGEG